jgi:HEAT repeat protein
MDLRPVEAILTEIGKAVRLFRYYPPSHPGVQRVMADLGAVLPALSRLGTVELRVAPSGFISGTTPLAPKSEPLRDLALVLYGQGHRTLVLEPGAGADEVAALVRALLGVGGAAGGKLGAVTRLPPLPHIRLDVALQPGQRSNAAGEPHVAAEPPSFSRQSTGVFRADALPLDIEAHRVVEQLESTPVEFLLASVARLEVLGAQAAEGREFGTLAEIVAALARLAAGDGDPMVREAAERAVRQHAVPAHAAGLVARLANPGLSQDERAHVVAAVASLGAATLGSVLDAHLTTNDPDVKEACEAVMAHAGAAAVPILARRLLEDRREARVGAAAMMGATGSATAAPFLEPLTHDTDWAVRAAAVAALGRLGGADAGRTLLAALRDADYKVRAAAAEALGAVGDPSSGGVLAARLAEEDEPEAACALAAAVGVLRERQAVPILADLAQSVSGVFQRRAVVVRLAAVRALGAIGTADARAVLERHRDDGTPDVRAAVLQALG